MSKRVFYTEISYVLGLIIMAFGAAFTEIANFGMSMIVAPAYILHLKVSEILPWFSFGVAEYCMQGLIVLLTIGCVRRFKVSYLFSFVTALLYGTILDRAISLVSFCKSESMGMRIVWFVVGTILCSIAVSLFFHTYISPEAYELIVKEISSKFLININKVKTIYDCISASLAVILSFAFFGFGVFRGVGIGTIICALINGYLIGKISAFFEDRFEFLNKLGDKYTKIF